MEDEKITIEISKLRKLTIFNDFMKFQYIKYENLEDKEKESFDVFEYKIGYEFYRAY